MNKVFTSMILALSVICTASAQSTSTAGQQQDPNEIIVLSSYVDGNYNVERLLVMESAPSNNEFVVRYKINLTRLISSYDNNSSEISGLRNFVESLKADSLKKITHFDIMGYASPDGPSALNKRLATERANDFCKFVDTECNMQEYSRTVSSTPYTWIDTKSAISSSNTPSKEEILSIIGSSATQSQIQAQIEQHGAAWNFIKENILPPMRSVEIHIKYNSWKVVENRTLIEEFNPEGLDNVATNGTGNMPGRGGVRNGEVDCDSGYEALTDDYIYCMLIEMPDNQIDFCSDEEREKLKVNSREIKYKESSRGERTKVKERKKRWWRR